MNVDRVQRCLSAILLPTWHGGLLTAHGRGRGEHVRSAHPPPRPAATRLARIWYSQDKTLEADDLLAPVYGWFTEGFDTADLQDAKALLENIR